MAQEVNKQGIDYLSLAGSVGSSLSSLSSSGSNLGSGLGTIGSSLSLAVSLAPLPGGPLIGVALGLFSGLLASKTKRRQEKLEKAELERRRLEGIKIQGQKFVKTLEAHEKQLSKSERQYKNILQSSDRSLKKREFDDKLARQISFVESISAGVVNRSATSFLLRGAKLRYDAVLDGAHAAVELAIQKSVIARDLLEETGKKAEKDTAAGKSDIDISNLETIDLLVG